LAHAHADSSKEQEIATSELLDHVQTWQRGDDVDRVGNDLSDERVLEAGVDKVLSSVVEDEVDTRQLLQGLQQASGQEPLAQGTLEALNVRRFAQRHLVDVVGLDLVKLFDDGRVVYGQTTESSETLCGLLVSIHLDQISRGLREKEESVECMLACEL
jgi:hypothetical protein